ncbi:DNA-binding transcriptional response regulator, NtrC family, contains REC, AAA-type ATPase, and a Fis-type DNA-binding domains [Myxococcus fulvus]|uniref:DNA-binding transcriptional response regulator, NtrC family, contains REC, AAA-type ATPase, and a Fis-type DNA-binding domains n=1 Tax=Myxococcus fulvus TaxID=33 RepID=A0ABY1CWX5_MYXFU|nr:DNA-binding transcriptional response regulator, NtrC family, contains REC, AAA-type ATPase, and a Fis-type DNA-binding domains [Myxococcus fulvus]
MLASALVSLPPDEEEANLDATATLTRGRAGQVKMVLRILSGPDSGKVHPLRQGTHVVGKAPTCDIVLADKAVSRQHLRLEVHDEHVVATDLESHNGSFCERLRFTSLELRPGSVITLGTTELKLMPEDTRERAVLLSDKDHFGALVGQSRKMREAFTLLERLAPGGADVLIQGETGTGKDLCAEAIHQQSPRKKGPFVIVDLAGVPPTLIESELFGHVKGSFTSAHGDRAGAFERAQGGTVFLDEVGELPLELQPRLLRVLERRQVKRVGANDYISVNMRVVAATHVNLEQAVQQGKFRRDLFHRLAVLRVSLPPLRERPEDIPALIDHMLKQTGRAPSALSVQTRALLAQYPWPGNVRELRNVVEQVVNLGEEALPELESSGEGGAKVELDLPFKEAKERLIEGFERDYLKNLLERCEGNISRAAREADIDRVYLKKLLRKHDLDTGRDS